MSSSNNVNVSANELSTSFDQFEAKIAAVSLIDAASYEDCDKLRAIHGLVDGVCAQPHRIPWIWCETGFKANDALLGKDNTTAVLSSYVMSFLSGSRASTLLRGFFACAKITGGTIPVVTIDGYSLTLGKYTVPLIGSFVDESVLFGERCDVTYFCPFPICSFARNVLSPDITCRAIIDIDHIARVNKAKYYFSTDPVVKCRPYYLSSATHAICYRQEDYNNLGPDVRYVWGLNRRSNTGLYMVGVCGNWGHILRDGNSLPYLQNAVSPSDRRLAAGDLVYTAAALQFGHLPVSDFLLGVHPPVECEKSRFRGLGTFNPFAPYGPGESKLPNVRSVVKSGPAVWTDIPGRFIENGNTAILSDVMYKIRVLSTTMSDFAPFGHPQHVYLRQKTLDHAYDPVICATSRADHIVSGVEAYEMDSITIEKYDPIDHPVTMDRATEWLYAGTNSTKSILYLRSVPMAWRLHKFAGASHEVIDSPIEWTRWQMDDETGFLIFAVGKRKYILSVGRNREGYCTAISKYCLEITRLIGLFVDQTSCRLLSRPPSGTPLSLMDVQPPARNIGVVRQGSFANFQRYGPSDYSPDPRSVAF